MIYKPGDRVLCERNGVQFAGTVYSDTSVVSDIDGYHFSDNVIIRKLEGLEAMKVGDVIVDESGDEAKILAITNNHTAFLKSYWCKFDKANQWYTFDEAKQNGWKLKSEPKTTLTKQQIADKLGISVEDLEIKG